MPSLLARRKATQRRALAKQRARIRRYRALRAAIQKARGTIARRRKLIRTAGDPPGVLALRAARTMLGKTETGNNDAAWLRQIENDLPHNRLDWMIPGNPYCGLGVIWSYWKGAGLELPDGTVYTPNILSYAGTVFTARDGRKYKLVKVAPKQATKGAIVVVDFTPGTGADHVCLARGPMRNGVIATVEFNTSPGNGGSQANGGGVYERTRPRAFVLGVLNVVPA